MNGQTDSDPSGTDTPGKAEVEGLIVEDDTDRCGLRHGIIGSAVIVLLMAAASHWTKSQIAAGTRLPTHFNAAGNPDRYGGPFVALWLMPLLVIGFTVLLTAVTRWEPRRVHIQQSMPAYIRIWLSIMVLLLVAHVATLVAALGYSINMTRVMLIGTGIMFIVIGNYMGKLRSNFFAGVRSPWTLSSELSWNKTHRLAGRLFVALGLLSVFAAWGGVVGLLLVYGVAVPGMVIWLLVYSYLVWKSDPNRIAVGNSRPA